jgi:hypothetical protein
VRKLARPIVNILEQAAVDRTKVGELEAASRNALGRPLGDKPAFQAVEPPRVA